MLPPIYLHFYSQIMLYIILLCINLKNSCIVYRIVNCIRISEKSIKKVQGTVEPTTNGKLLEEIIYELEKYEKDPWLF